MRPAAILSAIVLAAASCGILGSAGSVAGKSGRICGSDEIVGRTISTVDGPGACGIRRPVLVQSVSGVALTPGATVTCDAAKALSKWVRNSAKPQVARAGERLASLSVAASYSCRTRNSRAGARMSENGRGNAIDISALTFRDGQSITIAGDWSDPKFGPLLREMHGEACGTFGTTLGPGSDGHHEDHVHYDVARHSNGSYCR